MPLNVSSSLPFHDQEFDDLGITNYGRPGARGFHFNFVKSHHSLLEGDIAEAGVHRGKLLFGIAVMLGHLTSSKLAYAFDAFSGCPPVYTHDDEVARFDEVLAEGRVTWQHSQDFVRDSQWRTQLAGTNVKPASISSSGDLSLTFRQRVEVKVNILQLDNVVLVEGPFARTGTGRTDSAKIMCALIGCDLYESHITTLDFLWPRLIDDGLIYLDEFYSLGFLGVRIAIEVFANRHDGASIKRFETPPAEFERWGMWRETKSRCHPDDDGDRTSE